MLRPDTQALWDQLKGHPALAGFALVGGTALAIHLGHRVSEDLDFMIPRHKLPRQQIEALKRSCQALGFPFVPNDSPLGLMEFEDTGMDYHDYQQDYIVGGAVKLSLVAPDPEVGLLLNAENPNGPRVATEDEIFRLKCIACANRTKSRDWLDMYVMLSRGHFQPLDIYKSFELAKVPQKFDIAMTRMTRGVLGPDDEGYETLMDKPPTVEVMQGYFKAVFHTAQVEVARQKKEAMSVHRPNMR